MWRASKRLSAWAERNGLDRRTLLLLSSAVGLTGLASLCIFPADHALILFGMYAVPSHMLISPFPIEPPLLYLAKSNIPWVIALLACTGSFMAGCFDYLLLGPLLGHGAIRSKYEEIRVYKRASRLFIARPFLFLIVVHLTPIPFYPFKFLSIAARYTFWKYQLAMVLGRAPRYLLLAWFGFVVKPPDWTLIALVCIALIAFLTRRETRERLRRWMRRGGPDDTGGLSDGSGDGHD